MEIRYCPRCGEQRWPEARFCGICGFDYLALGSADATTGPSIESAIAEPDPVAFAHGATMGDSDPFTAVSAQVHASDVPGEPEVGWSLAADPDWATTAWPGTERLVAAQGSAGRIRRAASLVFAFGGAVLIGVATAAILLGLPRPSNGFTPVSSLQDLIARPADYVPLFAALGAAGVALIVAGLFAARIVKPALTVVALLAAGVVAEAVAMALIDRIGYDATGTVLPGPVILITGGSSILAAAFVGALIRD